jgi:hypothetical protein
MPTAGNRSTWSAPEGPAMAEDEAEAELRRLLPAQETLRGAEPVPQEPEVVAALGVEALVQPPQPRFAPCFKTRHRDILDSKTREKARLPEHCWQFVVDDLQYFDITAVSARHSHVYRPDFAVASRGNSLVHSVRHDHAFGAEHGKRFFQYRAVSVIYVR